MLQKTTAGAALVFAAILTYAQPARAQQTLNFTLGYFAPLGADARVDDDVLNANLSFLVFDIEEFGGGSVGGEWLVPLGDFVEAGAGLSFSRRTVPTVDQEYVDSDGTEIDMDLRVRQVPIAFTLRVLPLGQSSPVQPYVGAGLGIFNWRYSEVGEFVERDLTINPNRIYVDSGSATGPIVLGGLRFAGDRASAGGEIRYQKADADLSGELSGFTIDLGGWTYNFTIGVRF